MRQKEEASPPPPSSPHSWQGSGLEVGSTPSSIIPSSSMAGGEEDKEVEATLTAVVATGAVEPGKHQPVLMVVLQWQACKDR